MKILDKNLMLFNSQSIFEHCSDEAVKNVLKYFKCVFIVDINTNEVMSIIPVVDGKICANLSLACNTKYIAEFFNSLGIYPDKINADKKDILSLLLDIAGIDISKALGDFLSTGDAVEDLKSVKDDMSVQNVQEVISLGNMLSKELGFSNVDKLVNFFDTLGIPKTDNKMWKYWGFSGLVWDEDGKFYSVYENLPKDKKYETGTFILDKTYHEIPDFSNVHVKGNFYLPSRKLNSLKGAPSKVDGNFSCTFNNLESLEGAPEFVGGNFSCSFNRLTSLDNGPKKVGGYYTCCYNPKLKSDKCSTKVGKKFLCDYGITDDIEKMDFYRKVNRLIKSVYYDDEYSNRKAKHSNNKQRNITYECFDNMFKDRN